MYQVIHSDVLTAISKYPLYGFRLKNISTGVLYEINEIFYVSSEANSTTQSDDIEFGAVISQSLKVNMPIISDSLLGNRFKFEVYLKKRINTPITYGDLKIFTYLTLQNERIIGEVLRGELIPMGKFTCVRHRKRGGTSELELYDRLYFTNDIYVPSSDIVFPATSQQIEDDICSQIGCTNGNQYSESFYLCDIDGKNLYDSEDNRLKTKSYVFEISQIPENCSRRQMLSYIASANGQFGYIDRYGHYVRKWYDIGSSTNIGNQCIDEPVISAKSNKIIGCICHVPSLNGGQEITLTAGNIDKTQGRVIEFENPYMTQSLIDSLFMNAKWLKWYTAEINQRIGNPRYDLGDMLQYNFYAKIPITGLRNTCDGGFKTEIKAVGLNGEELL